MSATVSPAKSFRSGELVLAAVLGVLTLLTAFIALKAWTPAYAFHMVLLCFASAFGVYAIYQRYRVRDAEPAPQR